MRTELKINYDAIDELQKKPGTKLKYAVNTESNIYTFGEYLRTCKCLDISSASILYQFQRQNKKGVEYKGIEVFDFRDVNEIIKLLLSKRHNNKIGGNGYSEFITTRRGRINIEAIKEMREMGMTIEDIAKKLNVSRRHLETKVELKFGKTIGQMFERKRINIIEDKAIEESLELFSDYEIEEIEVKTVKRIAKISIEKIREKFGIDNDIEIQIL